MTSENEGTVRRFLDELWSVGDLKVADELVDADEVHHLGGELLSGPEGVKGAVTWLRTAFPDLRIEIDELLSAADLVAVRWTASGTHTGPFNDLEATGRRVAWTGADWFRLRGGLIVEVWAFPDGTLYDQLTTVG